ncbi:uncharacterized protein DUF3558 [Kutzneria buriramensis]|uniref:Uncharacterized protein DUF3558 n=1 Tax=Kutzneria buriramensis TaxID=1045776 RepID=A0A3E0HR12_9PSEU|nr:uncharacterized protein DUF3558 [Kutzneria buriramensis]
MACTLATLTAAACTSTGTGSPQPATSTTTSAASEVPKVVNSKTMKGIDACQLLTAQQLQTLGATGAPKKGSSPWGDADCTWSGDDVTINLAPDTTTGAGLAQTYKKKSSFNGFQPTTVSSYPAVQVNKQSLSCGLFLGVSDTQELSMTVFVEGQSNPDYHNPCAFAPKVAAAVLVNLPAAR